MVASRFCFLFLIKPSKMYRGNSKQRKALPPTEVRGQKQSPGDGGSLAAAAFSLGLGFAG